MGLIRDAEAGGAEQLAAGCILLLLAERSSPECRLRMGVRLLLRTPATDTGSIRPLIERLVAGGLVDETAEDSRHYVITAGGRAELDEWVHSVRGLVGTLDAALCSQRPSPEPKRSHAGRRRACGPAAGMLTAPPAPVVASRF